MDPDEHVLAGCDVPFGQGQAHQAGSAIERSGIEDPERRGQGHPGDLAQHDRAVRRAGRSHERPGYGAVTESAEYREGRATAVSFAAPRRVELVGVDLPAPGPGEVLVRTLWSGISGGTEMLAYRGQIDPALALDETIGALAGTFAFPFPYAYSWVGRGERSGGGPNDARPRLGLTPH